MTTAPLLLFAASFASITGDSEAVELRYSGTITQVARGQADIPTKTFSIFCIAKRSADGGHRFDWTLEERGAGGWAWPEQFGTATISAEGKPDGSLPGLLHKHDGRDYPVPLPQPVFEHYQRALQETTWEDGRLSWEVRRTRKIQDRDCWQIDVRSSRVGHLQTIDVDSNNGLVVASESRLTMGRGDQFRMVLQLDSAKPLEAESTAKLSVGFDRLLELQSALNRNESEKATELTASQLGTVKAAIPKLDQATDSSPLSRLVAVIARDVEKQQMRVQGVKGLADRFVGQPVPEFVVKTLSGKVVTSDSFEGRVTVLHFWNYQNEPLVEPYGQVAYLDFLYNKRRRMGVDVYGVAVNAGFGKPDLTAKTKRSAVRFQEFMNTGFPITYDAGELLTRFGDPAKFGAKLPLWVVIDHTGKIAHYHTGFYKVDRQLGLAVLDDAVISQLKKQREANGK